IILQAWLTLPSCLASSSKPTFARMIFWSWVIVVAVSVPGAGGGARSQLGVRTAPRPQHPLPKTNNDCQIKCKLLHYRRHGPTTLFAALDILQGKVIGRCMQRHRHQEFIRFLNTVEHEVAADRAVHVVLDNYAAHKHPRVRAWLQRHSRFIFHFTPTSCS